MKQSKNLEKELQEIKQILTAQTLQNDEHLDFSQAVEFTGFKKSYLYKLTCLKKISYFKPNGKKIYFSKKDLREWIFRNRHKSGQEIQDDSEKLLQGLEG